MFISHVTLQYNVHCQLMRQNKSMFCSLGEPPVITLACDYIMSHWPCCVMDTVFQREDPSESGADQGLYKGVKFKETLTKY